MKVSRDSTRVSGQVFDKEMISQENLSGYIFEETLVHARKAKIWGENNVRFSPVIIIFCVGLRDQLKKGKYDFLSKVFGLPIPRTVNRYDSLGFNEPSGLFLYCI